MAGVDSVSFDEPLVEVDGIYEKRDFLAFVEHVSRPAIRSVLLGAAMVTSALAVVRFLSNSGADFRFLSNGSIRDASDLLIYVFFFLFYIVVIQTIWYIRRLRAGQNFSDMAGAGQSTHLKFFEDRLETITESSEAVISWAGFKSFSEIPGYFFILFGPRHALIVPKRYFVRNSDIDAVRALLGRHL